MTKSNKRDGTSTLSWNAHNRAQIWELNFKGEEIDFISENPRGNGPWEGKVTILSWSKCRGGDTWPKKKKKVLKGGKIPENKGRGISDFSQDGRVR